MTTAMKLTTLALAVAMTAGASWAQTDDIDNARSVAKSLQQKQKNETDAALDAAGVGNPSKPAPGSPAPAVKPAVIPGANSAAAPAAKPAQVPATKPAAPAAKPAPAAKSPSASTKLEKVNVAQAGDGVQVEIVASQAVTPKIDKMNSPARLVVELPDTVDATPKNHIAFASAGVKGVRIGTDGKTPPTTSVVVDLEKAYTYELNPGSDGKLILTLHTGETGTQTAGKTSPAPAGAKPTAQPQTAAKSAAPAKSQAVAVPVAATKPGPSLKPAIVATASANQPAAKAAPAPKPSKDSKAAVAKDAPAKAAPAKTAVTADSGKAADAFALKAEEKKAEEKKEEKPEDKKWAMNGKRDPFFSPVVQQQGGSGCSTGKKCLEIGNINLRGVVKSDTGFIAVVTNSLNKAYFLRENDPVFNGYVMKITGDSVVFSETVQDKLGKPFTREVVKRIFTPAV